MIPAGTEPVLPFQLGTIRARAGTETVLAFPWVGVAVRSADPGATRAPVSPALATVPVSPPVNFPFAGIGFSLAEEGVVLALQLGILRGTITEANLPFAWVGVALELANEPPVLPWPFALPFDTVSYSSSQTGFFLDTNFDPDGYFQIYARHPRGIALASIDVENDDGSFIVQAGVIQAGYEGTVLLQPGYVGAPADSDLYLEFRPTAVGHWGPLTNWNWLAPTPPYDTYPVAPTPFPRFVRLDAHDGALYRATDEIAFVTRDFDPIFMVGGARPNARLGLAYSTPVQTFGGNPIGGFTWSVIAGALPAGISLVQGTPNATLSGTPTGPVGLYTFTLRVTDGTTTDDRPLSIRVFDSTYLNLVSITPALDTLGWDPTDPVTYIFESDGQIDATSFIQRYGPGSGAIFIQGNTHPGWVVVYTASVPSPGVNRLTITWIPVGDWMPGSNYGVAPGPYVERYGTYLIRTLDGLFTLTNPETGALALRFTTSSGGSCICTDMTSVSTGQRTVRVTFDDPVRRVPPLGEVTTWAMRRPDGTALTIVRVTVEPGSGPVNYVDLETLEEQSAAPALDTVEAQVIEGSAGGCDCATITAASTGPRTLRVTFSPPVRRIAPLGVLSTWAVRTAGGEPLTVVGVTVEPGSGLVTWVDLETREEQVLAPDENEVEAFTVEPA